MIDQPGVYELPLADYLADPCPEPSLSSRIAHALLTRSPAHAWALHPRLNPAYVRDETTAQEHGTLTHRLVLEHRTDGVVIVPEKDWKKKSAQQSRDAARAAGSIPILGHEWDALDAMVSAWRVQFARLDPPAFGREVGSVERTLIWREEVGSRLIWCRARPDHLAPGRCDDLKTTSGSGHPADWIRRQLWDKGYDLQAAMHRRGIRRLYGWEAAFRFIVCETDPPYGVVAITLDPEAQGWADRRLGTAMTRWGDCLGSGEWPGYPTRACVAEAPPYVLARWKEESYYR